MGRRYYTDKFIQMTDEEAFEFLEEYISLEEENTRLSVLGKKLDYSDESLVTVWKFVSSKIKVDENKKDSNRLPIWYEDKHCDLPVYNLSEESIWLIDALTYYVARCFISNFPEKVKWKVASDKKLKGYDDQNKPALEGFGIELNPLKMVLLAVMKVIRGKNRDTLLLELYTSWKSKLT